MQIEELKELIPIPRYNYSNLKRVYDYLQKNPGAATVQIGRDTGMGTNAYRYRNTLYEHKLINEHNVPIKSTVNRISKYEWPKIIIDGDNATGNSIVNLAALVARFNDDDEIPGFNGRTRKDLVERITKWATDNTLQFDQAILAPLHQSLAVASLITNNLEAFTNMTNVKPVGPEVLMNFKLKDQE